MEYKMIVETAAGFLGTNFPKAAENRSYLMQAMVRSPRS